MVLTISSKSDEDILWAFGFDESGTFGESSTKHRENNTLLDIIKLLELAKIQAEGELFLNDSYTM